MELEHTGRKAVVIGETRLCIQCAEILFESRWKIIYVVSNDDTVITWARSNFIPVLPSTQLNTIEAKEPFYLFSIINPYLISRSFLENKKLLWALNYHDSPLPAYAGINSTTWSIINNEKQHGVTIHKIEAGADTGDIVAQLIIPINKDETAVSLNLKCSEHLLSLFRKVIAAIESDKLIFTRQDLTNRSYYGLKNLPTNYGIINGIKDINIIDRLNRGLTFGDGYDNPVSTTKVFLKDNFYIVENFNKAVLTKNRALAKGTILFNTVRDIYGNKTDLKITYKDVLNNHLLSNEDLQLLADIKVQERKCRQQILEFFKSHSDASLKIFDFSANSLNNRHYKKKIIFTESITVSELLYLTCFILIRFFRENFVVSLYSTKDNSLLSLKNLVETRGFIALQKNLLDGSFSKLRKYLINCQANCHPVTKDFGYRYHLQLLTDIAITLGDIASTDSHRLVIKIKNRKIEFCGDVAYQLQLDSIIAAIKTISTKKARKQLLTADLKHFNILNKQQYKKIVYDWNNTEQEYPHDKTIHQLFEEQILKTPNNIAVVYGDKKLTYRELNEKANQLARYLQDCGVNSSELVAICLGRSEQMIVAILGVLKSGGAYVPIDCSHPSERISYVLKDTKVRIIITQKHIQPQLEITIRETLKDLPQLIVIDDETVTRYIGQQSIENILAVEQASDLAYVIYTSGTTGNPKGVMIEHRGINNLIVNQAKLFGLTSDRPGYLRCLQFASITFDASVSEIFSCLRYGHELYIVSDLQRKQLDKLVTLFSTAKIQVATLPPSLLKNLDLPSKHLKTLIVAGEIPDREILDKYYERGVRVINAYGPTETAVCATMNVYKKNGNRNIGRALGNVKLYVLSADMLPVAVGSIGELYIAGVGIARGYLNQVMLTESRFVTNPFQMEEDKLAGRYGKFYKTGDLVRFLSDGSLEYVGRDDFQVKIKGYRIELGEVEHKLLEYPGIKQALASVGEYSDVRGKVTGDKYIVVYYVADTKLDESKLHDFMVKQLPEYMLPRTFIYLKELPLNSNGKIDIKALPPVKFEGSHNYEAPGNERERLICEAFAKTLGLDKVGIQDDFFKLGGNSLAAIRLVSELQTNFNISIANIFNLRTPKKLADTESINLTKDFIKHKLNKIKSFYKNKKQQSTPVDQHMRHRITNYLKDSICILNFSQKPIKNVLLTGATGFLGCNLLHQLLNTTSYIIHLLIRASSQKEAIDRINENYLFYFNRPLNNELGTRIFVLNADIEKTSLGLPIKVYQNLVNKIDSIIHCAALVKLHGEYDKLESANVQATTNLLELAKLTEYKDFHYISTCSVLNSKFVSDSSYIYTEDDLPDNLEKYDSDTYVKTKLLGEQQVMKYRIYGIKSNIYRAGNLAFMSKKHQVQQNVEDNAFFNWLRYIFEIRCIAEEVSIVDLTPTDLAAQAIIKLFDKEQLSNGIYHIFNPHLLNVADIFMDGDALAVNTVPLNDFIDQVVGHLKIISIAT